MNDKVSPPTRDALSDDLASLRIPRNESRGPDAPRSRATRGFLIALAALCVLLVIGVVVFPYLESALFKTTVRVGEITAVSPAQSSTTLTATGYVVPQTLAKVAPKITGRVARVHVGEGSVVTVGQILLELDGAEQRSAIAAAGSRISAAQARVATAYAGLAEISLQAERRRKLAAEGADARATVEDLDARARSLAASVRSAKAEVSSARAEANIHRVALAQFTVTAPVNGTVLQKPPEVGDMVGPGSTAFEIADFATFAVEVDVPEARMNLLLVGAPCEIALDAFPSIRFRGAVREIGSRVDRAKATIPVKVNFVDKSDSVLPNMSARVGFLSEVLSAEALGAAEKILVPFSAVVQREGKDVVFVVGENGVARQHSIRIGARMGDAIELLEGPPPRTRVVISPPPTLRDGSKTKEGAD